MRKMRTARFFLFFFFKKIHENISVTPIPSLPHSAQIYLGGWCFPRLWSSVDMFVWETSWTNCAYTFCCISTIWFMFTNIQLLLQAAWRPKLCVTKGTFFKHNIEVICTVTVILYRLVKTFWHIWNTCLKSFSCLLFLWIFSPYIVRNSLLHWSQKYFFLWGASEALAEGPTGVLVAPIPEVFLAEGLMGVQKSPGGGGLPVWCTIVCLFKFCLYLVEYVHISHW